MSLKSLWYKFNDNHSNLIFHPQYYIKRYSNTSLDLAIKYSKGTLLDIGCGRMPYKSRFLKNVSKYIGIDHPKVSNLYKSLYGGYEKPDIVADATKIPLKREVADSIICMQVIEHLPDPDAALVEMKRLLKKGGYITISTVQSYPLHNEPNDYRRFTKFGLIEIMKKHGLHIIKVKEDGNIFVLIGQYFNIYLMLLLRRLVESGNTLSALFLVPFVLATTTIINIIILPFSYLDKNSKFRIVQTIIAQK